MSIYSAFNVGVSGVHAQSNRIGVISDNIANVSTTGYKPVTGTFEALINYDRDPSLYSPGGVVGGNKSNNTLQGPTLATASSTDVAIVGNGFFAVSATTPASGEILYTRAGSFGPDANGNFTNSQGYFLQGWLLDAHGELPTALTDPEGVDASVAIGALTTINPDSLRIPPVPTTTIEPHAILPAAQTIYPLRAAYDPTDSAHNMASGSFPPSYSRNITITDSLNVTHQITVGYVKTTPTTYTVEVYANPADDVTAAGGQLATGTLTIDSNGALIAVDPSLLSIDISWQNGAADSTLTEDWAADVPTLNASVPLMYNPESTTATMASGAVLAQYTIPVNVIDDQGASHTIVMGFLKTALNTWAVEIYPQTASDTTGANKQLAAGTLAFNNDGTLASVSDGLTDAISIPWSATDTAASSITFGWGTAGVPFGTPNATVIGRNDGMSQVDTDFTLNDVFKDGNAGGKHASISISVDGYVSAVYNDSSSRKLYKIPLATFADPNLLESVNATAFRYTSNTTAPVFRDPDSRDVGGLHALSLEGSSAEISSQLTDLIVAQRSYQFNTETISTTDSMMQTLTQMLR